MFDMFDVCIKALSSKIELANEQTKQKELFLFTIWLFFIERQILNSNVCSYILLAHLH